MSHDTCQCRFAVDALDQRIDQRFIDSDKRHDERFVNQRDYNAQHNNLQREMKDQAKEMVNRMTFDELKERVTKLERWPWLIVGVFIVIELVAKFWHP